MNKLTTKKLISYMVNRSSEKLRHEPVKLANACNKTAHRFQHDNAIDMLKLICFNEPIPSLHTHSYSFHTASGRNIINTIQEYYYEE
tara:strand:+ start:40 stop:300 length:261 start_codon:yes stop_codon:yes gene_type:complete